MKYSFSGLMRLKPFDESGEKARAGAIYAESVFFTIAILASGGLAITSLTLVIANSEYALEVLASAVGMSAVTAGLEWHVGLKAKALNQLFSAVLASLLFGALSS